MAQEEHTQKCSNSSGGGSGGGGGGGGSGGGGSRCSKKLKQKKVPQRGLGVAQLEKIRLEEQQKKDAAVQAAAILSPNSIMPPANPSCLAVQCVNFRSNSTPSSIPLPPSSPPDFSSPDSLFRTGPSIPNVNVLHPNSSKPLSGVGGEMSWPAILGSGQPNWPKLWNSEYNFEGESHRLDQHGLAFRSKMNLPYESWPPPNAMPRAQQFQQPSSSSVVNVPSGASSSSVMNFQMEPPSNQSYYGNNYSSIWTEEEKIVGMKRPYPFCLDNPPGPSLQCKFPTTYFPPITRSDESASGGNEGTINTEPGNSVFREGLSNSTTMCELNSEKVSKENGGLNGDFLTLAPPTTTLPHPSSKHRPTPAYVTPFGCELSEFEFLPRQGATEEVIHRQGLSGSAQQQPCYSFFLPANAQNSQGATTVGSCNGEVGEAVDLNLKL